LGITVAPREIEDNAFEKKWGVGARGGGLGMSILGDVQLTNTILANIVYGILIWDAILMPFI